MGNTFLSNGAGSKTDSNYRVGDIITSADIEYYENNSNWHNCDGSLLNASSYPELAKIISPALSNWTTVKDISTTDYLYFEDIAYGNGYYVIACTYNDQTAKILYATSLNGPWTSVFLWTSFSNSSSTYSAGLTNIIFEDGYFIACGYAGPGEMTQSIRIAYTTDPSGTWTQKDLCSYENAQKRIYNSPLKKINGYYVVGGGLDSYSTAPDKSFYLYTTSFSDTWTKVEFSNSITYYDVPTINNIFYYNSKWIFFGRFSSQYCSVVSIDNLGDTSFTLLSTLPDYSDHLTYCNNTFLCFKPSTSSHEYFYYSKNLTSWQKVSSSVSREDMLYLNGFYISVGLANSSDNPKTIQAGRDYMHQKKHYIRRGGNYSYRHIKYVNGYLIAFETSHNISYNDLSKIQLPFYPNPGYAGESSYNTQADYAFNYIKVK